MIAIIIHLLTEYIIILFKFVEDKPDFTKKLHELIAKEKDTVTFVCEMSHENVTAIWMKGGQKLTTDNKYQIVTDKKVQKLIIRDVTVKDKGEYTCIYRDTSTWAKLVVGGEFLWAQ